MVVESVEVQVQTSLSSIVVLTVSTTIPVLGQLKNVSYSVYFSGQNLVSKTSIYIKREHNTYYSPVGSLVLLLWWLRLVKALHRMSLRYGSTG